MSTSTLSKKASPSDFVWYNSEDDDEPIPQAQSTPKTLQATREVVAPVDDCEQPMRRPQRAAALANPFIGLTSKKLIPSSGILRPAGDRGRSPKQTKLSAKALGKRKAVDPPDDAPSPPKQPRPPLRDITDQFSEKSGDELSAQIESDAVFATQLQDRLDRRLSEPDSVDDKVPDVMVVDEDGANGAVQPQPCLRRIVKKNSTATVVSEVEEDADEDQYNDDELACLGENDYSKRGRFGMGREPSHKSEDVRTIFEVIAVKENGSFVKYFRCGVCWNNGKPRNKRYRFSYAGGVSNLRKHIRSNSDHFELYEERCNKRGIAMHQRAVPAEPKEMQTQLDFPLALPQLISFSREGLIKYITAFVVQDDQAFQVSDKRSFRELCSYLRPGLYDEDIPHRLTITREIQSQANLGHKLLRDKLNEVDSLISLTYDFGESPFAKDPYLPITASWIGGSTTSPNEWKIYTQCLSFQVVARRHNAHTLADMLFRVIDDFGIRQKLGWPVGDNLTVNDKAMGILGKLIRGAPNPGPAAEDWKNPMSRRGRCAEHSFNLAIGEVVKTVCPTTFAGLCKKLAEDANAHIADVDEEELPELIEPEDFEETPADEQSDSNDEEHTKDNNEISSTAEAEEEDDDVDVSDTVSKVLAIVRILRKSTQARLFFAKQCQECGLTVRRLKTFVKTRWSSLYDVLERYSLCKPALRRFFLLADDDEHVPRMRRKNIRNYSQLPLNDDEWSLVKLLMDILKPIALACQSWSFDGRPALYRVLPAIEFLIEQWEARLRNPDYEILHKAIEAGLDSLLKYYRLMDDTDVYIMTIFLIPRWKLRYIERRWEANDSRKALKVIQHNFDKYARRLPSKPKPPSKRLTMPPPSSPRHVDNSYGLSWMESVLAEDIDDEPSHPREELNRYLQSPRDLECDDAVLWWGRRQDEYPILSRIAKDYLAIPASSTASERLFSSAGLIGTVRRTSITPKNFEAVQFLKSSYKVGDISAESEVQRISH